MQCRELDTPSSRVLLNPFFVSSDLSTYTQVVLLGLRLPAANDGQFPTFFFPPARCRCVIDGQYKYPIFQGASASLSGPPPSRCTTSSCRRATGRHDQRRRPRRRPEHRVPCQHQRRHPEVSTLLYSAAVLYCTVLTLFYKSSYNTEHTTICFNTVVTIFCHCGGWCSIGAFGGYPSRTTPSANGMEQPSTLATATLLYVSHSTVCV